MKTRELPLESLVFDPEYYPRKQPDWITVERYKDAMAARLGRGETLWEEGAGGAKAWPPLHVAKRDDSTFVVLDGEHRRQGLRSLKVAKFPCIIHGLPRKEWLAKALELNGDSKRPLSKEERKACTWRLQQIGYDVEVIAKLAGMQAATLSNWMLKVAADGTPLKAPVEAAAGTVNEKAAIQHQGPFAIRTPLAALDQVVALLRCNQVDVSQENIRTKAVEIRNGLDSLLGGKKWKSA